MESIIIYPKNEKQKSLLKSLLEEMKVSFEFGQPNDTSLMSEQSFYSKIDKSLKQAEEGKVKILPKERQRDFLGL